MKNFIGRLLIISIALSAIVAGCASNVKLYMNKAANFQYVEKVAILPFNNLSDDRYAGEKLNSLVLMEILEKGVFKVAEDGEVKKIVVEVFKEMGYLEGDVVALDLEMIKKISSKLGVQAVFIGSVENYGQGRTSGSAYSVVSLTIKLVDGNSGTTLWRASYFQKGNSAMRKALGLKQKDELDLSRNVVKKLLASLF